MSLTIREFKFSEIAQGDAFKIADGRVLLRLYEATPAGENAVMLKGAVAGKLYTYGPDDAVEPLRID